MLVELCVENYAVIESVRVRFHAGLNLLTGENGSGKSIVVNAGAGSNYYVTSRLYRIDGCDNRHDVQL